MDQNTGYDHRLTVSDEWVDQTYSGKSPWFLVNLDVNRSRHPSQPGPTPAALDGPHLVHQPPHPRLPSGRKLARGRQDQPHHRAAALPRRRLLHTRSRRPRQPRLPDPRPRTLTPSPQPRSRHRGPGCGYPRGPCESSQPRGAHYQRKLIDEAAAEGLRGWLGMIGDPWAATETHRRLDDVARPACYRVPRSKARSIDQTTEGKACASGFL